MMKEWKLRILTLIAIFGITGGAISLGEWFWNERSLQLKYEKIAELSDEREEMGEEENEGEGESEKEEETEEKKEEKKEESKRDQSEGGTAEESNGEDTSNLEEAERPVPVTINDVETLRTTAPAIDFEALQAQNPDIVAWIQIPGTQINYPIVQAKDNSYYLHRDVERKKSSSGAIFLDYADHSDFSSLHNVIYGHHMKNGSMFKDISRYKDQAYLDRHAEILLYTPKRTIHLKALAAVCTSPDAIRRKTDFESGEEFSSYIQQMIKKAKASRPIEGTLSRLYSFVTCSYEFENARTILYAYEAAESSN